MITLSTASENIDEKAPISAWYALLVLTIVLLFATVDRAILSLLAEPVKQTLELSDFQVGFMQGTGIAIFAALAAYPMAWLSDRYGRRLILAISIAIWSLAVVGCALAQNYTQMFFATSMVGAGEAGLAPIAFTLIAEVFHRKKRQLANSVFVLASAAGGGLGMVISGQLVTIVEATIHLLPTAMQEMETWRIAFLYAAAPAPLMVLLVATIKIKNSMQYAEKKGQVETIEVESTEGVHPEKTVGEAPNVVGQLSMFHHLKQHRTTLLPFFIGMGCALFAFAAVGAWLPSILIRNFEQTPADIGGVLGALSLIGMAGGFLFSAFGIKFFEKRLGSRLQIRAMTFAAAFCTCTSFALIFATSATYIYIIQGIQVICLSAANMMYPTVLQNLAPPHLRARVDSISVVVNTGSGAAAAPIVGLLSDNISNPLGILWAAGSVACVALIISTVLFYKCERSGFVKSVEDIAKAEDDQKQALEA